MSSKLDGLNYSGIALARVADRELDLGFVRLPARREGVQTRVVQYERLMVALPAGHRLAGATSVGIAELADDPFVTFPAQGSIVSERLVQISLDAGFTPRIAQEAPDFLMIIDLVAAEVGVALTLSSVEHILNDGVVYKPLRDRVPEIACALAWRADNTVPALASVLRIGDRVLPTPTPQGIS